MLSSFFRALRFAIDRCFLCVHGLRMHNTHINSRLLDFFWILGWFISLNASLSSHFHRSYELSFCNNVENGIDLQQHPIFFTSFFWVHKAILSTYCLWMHLSIQWSLALHHFFFFFTTQVHNALKIFWLENLAFSLCITHEFNINIVCHMHVHYLTLCAYYLLSLSA
jgi:hypothetical protein